MEPGSNTNLIDVSVRISSGSRVLVSAEQFSIPRGKITFLFGESGIGKSLIARALFGLLDASSLEIVINRESYAKYLRSATLANIRDDGFFVFQEPSSHLNPLMKIQDQLREGSLAETTGEEEIFRELWGSDGNARVRSLLPLFPKPYRPSGGEKQRMLLAMAFKKIDLTLAQPGPSEGLFVFDEPTGSLDNALRNRFLDFLFRVLARKALTVLLITHDYSMISTALAARAEIRNRLAFRELSVKAGRTVLEDFSPEVYVRWLSSRKSSRTSSRAASGAAALSLESGLKVFGRRLIISREAGGREEPLRILKGRTAYVKAPSGEGKTTLAKAMMGLVPARDLRLKIGSTALTERLPKSYWRRRIYGKELTMVFQHADEALNLQSNVADVFNGLPLQWQEKKKQITRVLGLLFDGDEIREMLPRRISTLSGGQKQKLNLLRALILDTDAVILDEPFNGLDFESTGRVLELLDAKKKDGKGLLLVSHNEEIVETHADDVYYLRSEPEGPRG